MPSAGVVTASCSTSSAARSLSVLPVSAASAAVWPMAAVSVPAVASLGSVMIDQAARASRSAVVVRVVMLSSVVWWI